MDYIDLRSDTVTQPTPAMLSAMMKADVGDDVIGDDPAVLRLQAEVAELVGKEAGLFVPSGTMSNQIAIKVHTQPGTEVICDMGAHIYNYESGAPAVLSGVQMRPLACSRGILDPDAVEAAVRSKDNVHFAYTALIEIENTHNRAGGTITPLDTIRQIRELADRHGLPMHLDGARLWNAHVATGVPLREYARHFETLSVCFSKGLGAPVGSMLLGSAEMIDKARRFRKLFGGGMRQSGYLAEAARYAVKNHVLLLEQDHRNAACFAAEINACDGLTVDLETVQTNIVMIDVVREDLTAARLAAGLEQRGVRIFAVAPKRLRAVFHLQVDSGMTESAVVAFRKCMGC